MRIVDANQQSWYPEHRGMAQNGGLTMKWDTVKMVIALVLGIAIGAVAVWAVQATRGCRVEIVEGYTTAVNQDGTAIGLELGPDGPVKSYGIAGAFWRETGGSWNAHGPTCLEPGTSGQRVRLGVAEVEPAKGAPGRDVVVWLECLDQSGLE